MRGMLLFAASPALRLAPPVMQMHLQGGSLRTWSHRGPADQVNVQVGSDGRPVDAEFELWQGPGNTPVKMRVYGDDGQHRPVSASVGTGYNRWGPNTVAMRNTGPLEFPISADVQVEGPYGHPMHGHPMHGRPMYGGSPYDEQQYMGSVQPTQGMRAPSHRIQGGALRTFTFDGSVGSVQVNLFSEGMPINATVEILQGPNSDRQGIELYSDDGRGKPISYILETPGYGSTISITNKGPIEFPLTAAVVPVAPQRPDQMYGGRVSGMMGREMGGAFVGGVDNGRSRYGRGDRYGRGGDPYGGGRMMSGPAGRAGGEDPMQYGEDPYRGGRGGGGRFSEYAYAGMEGHGSRYGPNVY